MKRFVKMLFSALILGALGYAFRQPLEKLKSDVVLPLRNTLAGLRSAPCAAPIAYSLGSFDSRFALSKQDFLAALKDAEAIWEKPTGREFFAYAPEGALKVNLVYEYRQEATQRLQGIGLELKDDRASYEELKAKHDALETRYAQAKADYDVRAAAFDKKKVSYEEEVAYVNAHGGAPREDYERLQAEKTALQEESRQLQGLGASLNGSVGDINALVVVLNRLVSSLNLDVASYNEVGASRGREFNEGVYESDASGEKINIYEFSSRPQLVRLLAHELGHALGLEHVADPKAVMYKFNQGTNEKLTAGDRAELAARCGLQ